MTDLTERVAEAIYQADAVSKQLPTWNDGLHENLKELYRELAQAAIDALQLTEVRLHGTPGKRDMILHHFWRTPIEPVD